MKQLDSLRFRLAVLFRRSQMSAEMEEELRAHIELRADDLQRGGLDRAAAERQARLELGGSSERFREECQEAAGGSWFDSYFRDLRYSVRVLRKSPGFTLVAVGTLALAIGANAVAFAALNAVLLRPLNVPRPESLYSVHRTSDHSSNQSYPNYLEFRDRNRSFEQLIGYSIVSAGLDAGDNPQRVWSIAATGNYFDALGIQPHLGRMFHASDEKGPNSAPYIVLAHGFWQSHFHGDPGVVGRVVQVNKHPFTILGVTPPEFHGTLLFMNPSFFFPMVNQEQIEGRSILNARGSRWIFMTMGHLKPGVTPEQAAADVNSISQYLENTYPKDHAKMHFVLGRPSMYGDYMGKPLTAFVTALMLLAGLILLAACANLGSLFAARAADRSREVALRLALGASRLRILRQLFTEALLISLAGGALGLWGSIQLLAWLSAWQPIPQFPINIPVSPDANVYAVAVLLALASGFLFGAVPVRQVLRTDPYEVVKSGALTTPGRRFNARDLLVVGQIAICAVLITASMVAVRGLVRSMYSDFGFHPANAIMAEANLDMAGYRGEAVTQMQKRMLDAMKTLPGVSGVALVDNPPLFNGSINPSSIFTEETTDFRPANALGVAATMRVSPAYLRVAGTTLLSGRDITEFDGPDAPLVALVNPEFTRKVFGPGVDPLGRYFKTRDGTRVQVVGMVEQGKYGSLTEEPRAAMFLPILQAPSSDSQIIVRHTGDPQQVAAAVRGKLRELDRGLPSYIQTWEEGLNLVMFPSRVAAVSLGILGLMGAMLSITGIFGLAAYSVSKRLRELGIRMALGAQTKEVVWAALGRAFKLLGFGSAAGLALGILASRVLAAVVYQATPRDPVILAGVVLAMLLLGLLATWIPARRALSIDPWVLLREQ